MSQSVTESVAETTEEIVDTVHGALMEWIWGNYFEGELNLYVGIGMALGLTLGVAAVAHLIARMVIVGIIRRVVRRTRTKWDDFLVERRLFTRIAHLVPAIVIYSFAEVFFYETWQEPVQRFALSYMILVGVFVCLSVLNAAIDIYGTLKIARSNPIKGFVGGAKIFVFLIGGIFLVATVLGKEPWRLVAGLGAVTAMLLLVFKDSILGLVASIQIITNDLVHLGDWIEMPQYGADGDVVDISLTTIKVQNWDNTVTTIPTYALISESFKNWRSMTESGGRRIKRSFSIDMNTIKFLNDGLLRRFEKFELLSDYVRTRQQEVAEYNQKHGIDTTEVINGRRLTNLGTFRAYLKEYLKRYPKIRSDMTFLVRYLAPSENGMPVEIYVFSGDTNWANYEGIQADIIDHVLAVLPEFELAVFQNPTGDDLRDILDRAAAAG